MGSITKRIKLQMGLLRRVTNAASIMAQRHGYSRDNTLGDVSL